jgi:hypothetical protein
MKSKKKKLNLNDIRERNSFDNYIYNNPNKIKLSFKFKKKDIMNLKKKSKIKKWVRR